MVLAQMPKYADALRTLESAEVMPTESPEDYGISVTPFGTGSAIPSKYRNGKPHVRTAFIIESAADVLAIS